MIGLEGLDQEAPHPVFLPNLQQQLSSAPILKHHFDSVQHDSVWQHSGAGE